MAVTAESVQKRVIVVDRFPSGPPRTFLDTKTGETYSSKQYNRLRKQGFFDSETPVDGMDGAAAPEPPDAPNPFKVLLDGGNPVEEKTAARDRKGFFETVAPGITSFAYLCTQWAFPADAARLVPPPHIGAGVVAPLTRIADRHNPFKVLVEASEDGKDIAEAVGAAGVCAMYIVAQLQEMRKEAPASEYINAQGDREAAYNSRQAAPAGRQGTRTDERAQGNGRTASASTGASGSADSRRRDDQAPVAAVSAGGLGQLINLIRGDGGRDDEAAGAGSDAYDTGLAADGAGDTSAIGRQAASVRALLEADAIGRQQRGLG